MCTVLLYVLHFFHRIRISYSHFVKNLESSADENKDKNSLIFSKKLKIVSKSILILNSHKPIISKDKECAVLSCKCLME